MTRPIESVEQHLKLTDLRDRVNSALAVLSHRGYSEATARTVEDILRGRSLRELVDERRAELAEVRQHGMAGRHAARLRHLRGQAEGGVA